MADNVNIDDLSLTEKDPKQDTTEEISQTKGTAKIDVLLKATGDAPIIKRKRWAIDEDKKIGWVIEFLKKYMKIEPPDSLFLYVNQCFAPSPDQIIRNLYNCFGADGKLVLHYCKTQAWG